MRLPTFFVPHGGGPCFFMDDPRGIWTGMADFLRSLPERLPAPPKAILCVSGHWETEGLALTAAAHPSLYFDYHNFPPHTYALRYDAPGDPALAERIQIALRDAGVTVRLDATRGLDHGVFIPLMVAFPEASIPVIELSLDRELDPAFHLAVGQSLAELRDEGVLILATGMSFHNMRGYGDPRFTQVSADFDMWLTETLALDDAARATRLRAWQNAPGARQSHPEAEHLLPLMVAAGASEAPGHKIYSERVLETVISAFMFP